ncbi:hypothetical protein [Bacteroidetes bacterium endosymbiont of Geopemphigus sp.]|nr:hypothetical protein [Bacteroidetes bacterium endosymbiont of Geopemphigus sp.]
MLTQESAVTDKSIETKKKMIGAMNQAIILSKFHRTLSGLQL